MATGGILSYEPTAGFRLAAREQAREWNKIGREIAHACQAAGFEAELGGRVRQRTSGLLSASIRRHGGWRRLKQRCSAAVGGSFLFLIGRPFVRGESWPDRASSGILSGQALRIASWSTTSPEARKPTVVMRKLKDL